MSECNCGHCDQDLKAIITQFAECGWDVLDAPAKAWLAMQDCPDTKLTLITAVKKADEECGSCGCDMDPLYKKALELLAA